MKMFLKISLKVLVIILLCEQINVINGVASDDFGFNIYKGLSLSPYHRLHHIQQYVVEL